MNSTRQKYFNVVIARVDEFISVFSAFTSVPFQKMKKKEE